MVKHDTGPLPLTRWEIKPEKVEAAMDALDRAKESALKQRTERAKYLQWKVQMQRKERKLREMAEATDRVNLREYLHQVLKEHRTQRREQALSYYRPITNTIPATAIVEDVHEIETTTTSEGLARPYSEPVINAPQLTTTQPQPPPRLLSPPKQTQIIESTTPLTRSNTVFADNSTSNSIDTVRKRTTSFYRANTVTLEHVLKLPSISPGITGLVSGNLADLLPSPDTDQQCKPPQFSPTVQKIIKETRKCRIHTNKVCNMSEKAKLRKSYASQRVMEDPPADVLLELQYQPSVKPEFFITEVGADHEGEQVANGLPLNLKRSKYKHFDPYRELKSNVMKEQKRKNTYVKKEDDNINEEELWEQSRQALIEYAAVQQYIDHVNKYAKLKSP